MNRAQELALQRELEARLDAAEDAIDDVLAMLTTESAIDWLKAIIADLETLECEGSA